MWKCLSVDDDISPSLEDNDHRRAVKPNILRLLSRDIAWLRVDCMVLISLLHHTESLLTSRDVYRAINRSFECITS